MGLDLDKLEPLPKAIILDVDGTTALISKRNPYDHAKAYDDLPNVPVVETVKALYSCGYAIIVCSGRMVEFGPLTEAWFSKHVPVPIEMFLFRANGDTRRDSTVKRELYGRYIKDRYDILLTIDDRKQVVQECWRDMGLTCLQCAEGDF